MKRHRVILSIVMIAAALFLTVVGGVNAGKGGAGPTSGGSEDCSAENPQLQRDQDRDQDCDPDCDRDRDQDRDGQPGGTPEPEATIPPAPAEREDRPAGNPQLQRDQDRDGQPGGDPEPEQAPAERKREQAQRSYATPGPLVDALVTVDALSADVETVAHARALLALRRLEGDLEGDDALRHVARWQESMPELAWVTRMQARLGTGLAEPLAEMLRLRTACNLASCLEGDPS